MTSRVGIVVVGRNEGQRLVRCLESLRAAGAPVVYADSGSTDGSPARARALGAEVVELDPARPFSAARGRNEGFARLRALAPEVAFVQFLDGDCELDTGWLEPAAEWLDAHPDVAVVAGRVRERRRDANAYHRLADMEWDVPAGDALACGGVGLFRASTLIELGGFRTDLIAGEEPELCLRIRARGLRIVRLEREMVLHEADIDRFAQWWRRQVRAGHAYAEVVYRHRWAGDAEGRRALRSIAFWGGALPALTLIGVWIAGPGALALLLAYGVLAFRIGAARRRHGDSGPDAVLYALACVVGKFAQLAGAMRFAWNRLLWRRGPSLIEYKHPTV